MAVVKDCPIIFIFNLNKILAQIDISNIELDYQSPVQESDAYRNMEDTDSRTFDQDAEMMNEGM